VPPTFYRFAPAVAARFVGLAVVALAVLMFVVTIVVAAAGGSMTLVVLVLAIGLVAVGLGTWWLLRRAYVVRCDEVGYRVRMVRGAGVSQASWGEVEGAAAVTVRGVQLLDLRLSGDRVTHIPVALLALDKEEFVRAMRRHLQAGQQVRPLS